MLAFSRGQPLDDDLARLAQAVRPGESCRRAFVMGLESPLASGRSVVVITAQTPEVMPSVAELRGYSEALAPQADVLVKPGTRRALFHIQDSYDTGTISPCSKQFLGRDAPLAHPRADAARRGDAVRVAPQEAPRQRRVPPPRVHRGAAVTGGGAMLALAALATLGCGTETVRADPAPACGPDAAAPWAHWEAYKKGFIQADGRVVDNLAKHTTSEGQAYAMFLALVARDEPTFRQVLAWADRTVARRRGPDAARVALGRRQGQRQEPGQRRRSADGLHARARGDGLRGRGAGEEGRAAPGAGRGA